MRMTTTTNDQALSDFAKRAADFFAKDIKHTTFTDKDIEADCLFAVRWGGGNDCVLVFKLDECFEPIVYQNEIKQEGK